MSDHGKVQVEIQLLPGESIEDRIAVINKTLAGVLQQQDIKTRFEDPESAYKIEADEDFVAEGVTIGITIWFLEKIASKIFDEYIWPELKSKIDGMWK